jgi:helicase
VIDAISQLHNSKSVQDLVRTVDAACIEHDIGIEETQKTINTAIDRLRMAAYLALSDIIGEKHVDNLLREFAAEKDNTFVPEGGTAAFNKWSSYINALQCKNEPIPIDDLISFSAIGFLAKHPVEVRTKLRQNIVDDALSFSFEKVGSLPWIERVKTEINIGLLILIRQKSYQDVDSARTIIQKLALDQQVIEKEWLSTRQNPQRDAMVLLGLYHLAHSVIRLSQFLLAGSVETDGVITDFAPELRRLLTRAENYLILSADIDVLLWLNIIVVILWKLRTDSIWVSSKGISPRIDELLAKMSDAGREKPIFSLMPSQQDALRQHLLDPTKIAIVLQMPTNTGKTLLAEFSIVQTFETYKDSCRVVYVVPTRALATQIQRTLAEDLGPLNIQVAAAGSAFEEDPYELQLLSSTDGVVVSTPEKLDLLFRSHPEWFDKLRRVIIDEAHLMHEGERGVRLELLLANIRREHPETRLLLLTPFVENAPQIATWLGENRGLSIDVHWRPSRLLLGLTRKSTLKTKKCFSIDCSEPYDDEGSIKTITIPVDKFQATTTGKTIQLAEQLIKLGTVLALYSASPTEAEKAAKNIALTRDPIPALKRTPSLRVAIAIAKDEYGDDSTLSYCLDRGVAFHHSSLSSILRYLVEDQVRNGLVDFISATTTLAQGMNFPVAVVLVHSVHKPNGRGDLTPSEFWNVAGRAGRVGLVDKGLVIFVNEGHEDKFNYYKEHLSSPIRSALLETIHLSNNANELKDQYKQYVELRPFMQYLAHAAAHDTPQKARDKLDELLQGSLANVQIDKASDFEKLYNLADRYLESISGRKNRYLKASDSTGLGSFSFDELFAKIMDDPVLLAGPKEVIANKQQGIYHLIDALKWLPELSLAIGFGSGQMNVGAVARVVQEWIDGLSIPEISKEFPDDEEEKRIRHAASYLFGEVSQTVSWGAHAYLKSWGIRHDKEVEIEAKDRMLGAYIQYGVNSPEAAVASLLGIPRQFADGFATEYCEIHGKLTPDNSSVFKDFIETADSKTWNRVTLRSRLAAKIDSEDVRYVWHQMRGKKY